MNPLAAKLLFVCCLLSGSLCSQDSIFSAPKKGVWARVEIIDGDSVPVIDLNTVVVYGQYELKTKKQREQWTRVKYNVKKVYPYAIIASAKLKEYDFALSKMKEPELRKAFIRVCEKDLRQQFENDLKNLSVSQGKVLMKLIDRETGKTTYQIVKEMRGGFQAAMWQSLAALFGNSMKVEYEPEGEDIMIERAVKLVEAGQF